jgi:hypothetical protein
MRVIHLRKIFFFKSFRFQSSKDYASAVHDVTELMRSKNSKRLKSLLRGNRNKERCGSIGVSRSDFTDFRREILNQSKCR